MKEIPLTRGKVAIIDDEDFEIVSRFKWHVASSRGGVFYANSSKLRHVDGRTVGMHRLLLAAPRGVCVDHINGDGLDNRRCNIRLATYSKNMHNSAPKKNSKSPYKGISYHKRKCRWIAKITNNRRCHHIGYYHSPVEAARAYDIKARELFGEFARINFPEPLEDDTDRFAEYMLLMVRERVEHTRHTDICIGCDFCWPESIERESDI